MVNPPAFNPAELQRVGHELAAQAPVDEGRFRTAVGRLYYAVFLTARISLRVEVEQDVHTEVIRTLRMQNRAVADQLDALRRIRTTADYEMVPRNPGRRDWQRNWADARALADRLMPMVRAVRPAP